MRSRPSALPGTHTRILSFSLAATAVYLAGMGDVPRSLKFPSLTLQERNLAQTLLANVVDGVGIYGITALGVLEAGVAKGIVEPEAMLRLLQASRSIFETIAVHGVRGANLASRRGAGIHSQSGPNWRPQAWLYVIDIEGDRYRISFHSESAYAKLASSGDWHKCTGSRSVDPEIATAVALTTQLAPRFAGSLLDVTLEQVQGGDLRSTSQPPATGSGSGQTVEFSS